MKFNRRNFITNTALGVLGLGFSSHVFSQQANNNSTSILEKLQLAAQKRRQGKLIQAKNLYKEVITLKSDEIRAYDGIRKILLQDKFKELEVLNLYKEGMNANPTSAIFKERVAKEYLRIGLGNKKFAKQLPNSENLLQKAKNHFIQAQDALPVNKQITEQIQKVNRKQNQNADTIDARKSAEQKNYKKEQKKNYKQRYKGQNVIKLETILAAHISKPKTAHREKHIKELYFHILKKYKKIGNELQAIQHAKNFYLRNPTDVYTLKIVRKIGRKFKNLNALEWIERQNNTIQNTFWSKMALFDVLFIKYKKNQGGSILELQNLLSTQLSNTQKFVPYFELKTREIKLALHTQNYPSAFTILDELGNRIRFISSTHFIDRYNILVLRYFNKIKENNKLSMALAIALQESIDSKIEDTFLLKLIEVNQNKNTTKSIHKKRLLAFREKLFNNAVND